MADFDENKITYQQLVMRQVRIIQDISSKELRDASKTLKNFMGTQEIESEDTRLSYLQAVEMLGSLLSPYFQKNSKISTEFDEYCDTIDMQLKEILEDKDFLKEVENIFGKDFRDNEKTLDNVNAYFIQYQRRCARKIFRDLIQLFKDNDFLAGESYSEGSSGTDEGLDAVDDELEEGVEIS